MEEGRHAAIISGRTYLEGEAYGNFRVAKIHRDWVLLTHSGGGSRDYTGGWGARGFQPSHWG
jgi:hypothetical protein